MTETNRNDAHQPMISIMPLKPHNRLDLSKAFDMLLDFLDIFPQKGHAISSNNREIVNFYD